MRPYIPDAFRGGLDDGFKPVIRGLGDAQGSSGHHTDDALLAGGRVDEGEYRIPGDVVRDWAEVKRIGICARAGLDDSMHVGDDVVKNVAFPLQDIGQDGEQLRLAVFGNSVSGTANYVGEEGLNRPRDICRFNERISETSSNAYKE